MDDDTYYEIRVTDRRTGSVIKTFAYSVCGNSEGWSHSGTHNVRIDQQTREIVAVDYDGDERRFPLPD